VTGELKGKNLTPKGVSYSQGNNAGPTTALTTGVPNMENIRDSAVGQEKRTAGTSQTVAFKIEGCGTQPGRPPMPDYSSERVLWAERAAVPILDLRVFSPGSRSVMGKKKFGFSRVFLGVIGSIVFLLFAVYGWGLQTMVWWQYKGFSKKAPILKLTPRNPPMASLNTAQGMKLSYAGFEFEVPWADLDGQKSKFVKSIAVYAFNSGRVVEFFGPSQNHKDLLATAEESMADKHGNLRRLFGEEATKSNYIFHKTMLERTPEELKPWMNQREAYRVSLLLLLKGGSSVGGETGLFDVEKLGWKGFQFDDPDKKPKKVTLELYDSKDEHVEIMFFPGKGEGAGITQSDVYRVLQTLAPVVVDGTPTGAQHAAPLQQKKASTG